MRSCAIALRGGGDLAGILLQEVDQLGQARCLDLVRIDQQRVWHLCHHDNRFELRWIECELWIETLVDDKGWRRRREQGVAIGVRTVDRFGADVSGRTGAVLDDHRLPPFARQPVRDQPRNGIGSASGGKRNNDFDSAVGIDLRPCRARKAVERTKDDQSDRKLADEAASARVVHWRKPPRRPRGSIRGLFQTV